MPRIFTFLLGVAVGAFGCFGASNYHVVRAKDGFHLVPKVRPHISEAYVDVRSFGVGDWTAHQELVAALTKANQQSVMESSATNSMQQGLNQVKQSIPNWPQN